MESIPKADALTLVSNWERHDQRMSIFCFSSSIALSSKQGRVAMCLDDSIDLLLEGETSLRIFISEATFSTVEPKDLPAESVSLLPQFRQGIRIALQNEHMQWFLLA
jgi:hypothetical protein